MPPARSVPFLHLNPTAALDEPGRAEPPGRQPAATRSLVAMPATPDRATTDTGRTNTGRTDDATARPRATSAAAAPSTATNLTPVAWIMIGAVMLVLVLHWLDDTTELTPSHDGVLNACFWTSGLIALLCIGLFIRKASGINIARRVVLALVLGFMALIVAFTVSDFAAAAVEGWIDFPRGRTTTVEGLLSIQRAYRTHGRYPSWNIQTTPFWSDLYIAEQDYDFMLAHRRPGDVGRNPDEISSRSYFCARVTLERSGDALRVMHAGTHQLPTGTVVVCPSSPR